MLEMETELFWRGGGEIFPCTVMQPGHTTALRLWRRRKGRGGGKRRNLNRSLAGWMETSKCVLSGSG